MDWIDVDARELVTAWEELEAGLDGKARIGEDLETKAAEKMAVDVEAEVESEVHVEREQKKMRSLESKNGSGLDGFGGQSGGDCMGASVSRRVCEGGGRSGFGC